MHWKEGSEIDLFSYTHPHGNECVSVLYSNLKHNRIAQSITALHTNSPKSM